MRAPLGTTLTIIVLAAGLEAQTRFVYSNNDVFSSNTVSGFSAAATGVLTQIAGSPFPTGGGGTGGGQFAANRIAIAGGKFLYAANDGTHTIAAFSIDPNTGILTPVATSPYPAGATAGWGDISLAASPNGQYLFAGVASNLTLVTFSIGADGSLSQVASTTLPAAASGMKVAQDGQFLAVGMPAYNNKGAVAMFSVASNGALTMVSGTPVVSGSYGNLTGVDIDCAGSHLFGAETIPGTNAVDVFNIAASGALAAVPGSPFAPGGGSDSNVNVLSPNDQFLFVSNQGSTTITVFNVNSTGALSLVTGSPFSAGDASQTYPTGLATDQSGALLYAGSSPNLISVFQIAASGALSQVQGSPFSTGQTGGQLLSLVAFPGKTCTAPPAPNPPPVTPPPSAITVTIDIGPKLDDNDNDGDGNGNSKPVNVNRNSHGTIRVAILSSATFNAPAAVNMSSLTFGHSGSEKSLAHCDTRRRDVNHDGHPDLVCHFYMKDTDFQKGDTLGILKGMLMNGTPIYGAEAIRVAH
jgi:6-phosphogluconolactonase